MMIVIVVIYALFLAWIHPNLQATNTAYYNYLIDAFWHGRSDVASPTTFDLSHYNGKWYLYWGPSPTLFILPFYVLSRLQASDIVYGFVAGLLNVVIFAGCVREFVRYFQISVGWFGQAFVILNFAFLSPNFYLALGGTIWYVNQIISTLYLLLFLFFLLKFLNTLRVGYLVLSTIAFSLAWNARLSLICQALLFIYVFVVTYQKRRELLPQVVSAVIGVSLVSLGWFLGYNQARFSHPLEIGYKYQTPAERFASAFSHNDLFSLKYVPHNATYYFLHHVSLRFERPYLEIDPEGNSIFSVYPMVLLILGFVEKSLYTRANRLFLGVLGIALLLDFGIILSNVGTGWVQFGSRYFLDLVPGLFLAILFVVERVARPLQIGILLYGVPVNFLGTLLYYHVIQWIR